MLNRAYSVLNIKSFKEVDEQRIIKGIATSAGTDRDGDEVDPSGAVFKTPLPLLLHHDQRLPVGTVEFARNDENGVSFIAKIAKIDEDGELKKRTDEAWQSIKAGIIRGVSIGFKPLKMEKTRTGNRFKSWEWFELSLVSIPANANATFEVVKSMAKKDKAFLVENKSDKKDEVSDFTSKNINFNLTNLNESEKMSKYNEKIANFKKLKRENEKKIEELIVKSLEDALSDDEKQELINLREKDNDFADKIKNLEFLVEKSKNDALEVKTNDNGKTVVKNKVNRKKNFKDLEGEKGLRFASVAKCIVDAKKKETSPVEIAKQRFNDPEDAIETIQIMTKAAVAPATTSDEEWAGALVPNGIVSEFLEYQEGQSVLGQLNLREVPFGSEWVESLGGGQAYWVGEGQRKVPTRFALRRDGLERFKLAALAVLTEEMVQDSSPKADLWVRDELTRALNIELDTAFLDPTNAGIPNVKPASITNGVAPIASTGDIEQDYDNAVLAYLAANNNSLDGAVFIFTTEQLFKISRYKNPLTGVLAFTDISNGTVGGIRYIVSDTVNVSDSSGSAFFLVNENAIVKGYSPAAPGLIVKWSDQASVVLNDDPDSDDVPTSLWQNNLIGCLVERRIDWKKQRLNTAVITVNGINW